MDYKSTIMMSQLRTWLFFFTLILFALTADAQKSLATDLHKAVKQNKVVVDNRELSLLDEEGYKGIRLSKDYGEGVAWMKDIDFKTGTLEFDVRGEDLKQHSFVGMAFHAQNDSTYDAVYLRPFHFQSPDSISQKRMIQFISLPDFPWRKLRGEFPGKFEGQIASPPEPSAWVHMRIEVTASSISVYINENKTPSLVVNPIVPLPSGKVGFYVADTSGGDFANLSVVKD